MEFTCDPVQNAEEMEAVLRVRRPVFVGRQAGPGEEEWDAFDAIATHFALRWGNQVVGAARLVDRGDGWFKVGRVAVLPDARGRGGGAMLMATALALARTRGARGLLLDAQVAVIPFY